jgi:hypothetical protein
MALIVTVVSVLLFSCCIGRLSVVCFNGLKDSIRAVGDAEQISSAPRNNRFVPREFAEMQQVCLFCLLARRPRSAVPAAS